jgi:hypothetical protein
MTINRHYPVTRYPTDIPGLLYRPSIEPEYSDDADYIEPFHSLVTDRTTPDQHYSAVNRRLLQRTLCDYLDLDKRETGLILEIGVAIVTDDRPFENTSTFILTENKADGVTYIGVDLARDKKVTDDPARNIYYHLGIDSWQWLQYTYPAEMDVMRRTRVDLIHIDGNHSVNTVLKDWQYTELLAPYGVAVFHDINVHPGPAVVLDAVDPALFVVRRHFTDRQGDFGMATVMRRRFKP